MPRNKALLESLMTDTLAKRKLPNVQPAPPKAPETGGPIVERRDEPGVKHPQDFPNPASDAYAAASDWPGGAIKAPRESVERIVRTAKAARGVVGRRAGSCAVLAYALAYN